MWTRLAPKWSEYDQWVCAFLSWGPALGVGDRGKARPMESGGEQPNIQAEYTK